MQQDFKICNIDDEVEIVKEGSASVIQDILMGTYWANIVGKTRFPGVYQMYQKELKENMAKLLKTPITYRELESILDEFGYEVTDIRQAFKELTGIDPEKFEFMRIEDVKNTPSSIPAFNLGWGYGKKNDGIYFISKDDVYVINHQIDDTTRKQIAYFSSLKDARKFLETKVDLAHYYDIKMNELDELFANKELKAKAQEAIPKVEEKEESSEVDEVKKEMVEEMSKELQSKKVEEEIKSKTPTERFQESIKDKMDMYIADHIKDVLAYINQKNIELKNFEVSVKNIHYEKKEDVTPIVSKIDSYPSTVYPKIVISVVLEVKNKNLPEDKNKRFALALFFVSKDGKITTTDSVKGEDDIIYGFSDDGFTQYFSSIK